MPCVIAQSCLTPSNTMDCSLLGSSVHGDAPGKNTGMGYHALLQGIVPTHEWNPDLPHWRWILYRLSHQGSPRNYGVGSLSFLQGIFPTQEMNQGLLHCRQILYQLRYKGSPLHNIIFQYFYTFQNCHQCLIFICHHTKILHNCYLLYPVHFATIITIDQGMSLICLTHFLHLLGGDSNTYVAISFDD